MLKSVKLKEEVYEALDRAREKRESFSETVARLLRVYDSVKVAVGSNKV